MDFLIKLILAPERIPGQKTVVASTFIRIIRIIRIKSLQSSTFLPLILLKIIYLRLPCFFLKGQFYCSTQDISTFRLTRFYCLADTPFNHFPKLLYQSFLKGLSKYLRFNIFLLSCINNLLCYNTISLYSSIY